MSLWNVVRGMVADMLAQQPSGRHGIVANVDTTSGTVRVVWDEDGTLSGHLPVVQIAAGNGWSGVCYPLPGTQVFGTPDMADAGSMVIHGQVHSTQQPPAKITPYQASSPIPIVPGEITFTHASGASFRLTAGGVIEIHGTLKVDGDLLVSGDISDKNAVHGTLDLLRTDHNAHGHPNIVRGGSLSDPPNLQTP